MPKVIFFIFFALGCIQNVSSQKISTRKLEKIISNITAFDGAQVGVQLVALSSGKVLATSQSNRYFTPASNTKLLTTLAAAQTFDTLPVLRYQKDSLGVLHIAPTGYPLLWHPRYPDSELDAFLAQADSLVYHPVDESHLNRLGPGWSWDDADYYFSAIPSAFPVHGNVLQITKNQQNQALAIHPRLGIVSEIMNAPISVQREFHRNHFTVVSSKVLPNDTLYIPFIPSEKNTIQLLENSFKKNIATDNSTLEVSTVLRTNAAATLYQAVLQQSDNLISENLLLMIAQQRLGRFSTKEVIQQMTQDWASAPDAWVWVDGSGLSRYNLVTPRNLIWILQQLHAVWGPGKIRTYFPQAGVSGTLKRAYASPRLPAIYAKTGTLRNNHNLSGYIIASDQQWYAFSIMVNQHTTTTTAVKKGIRQLLEVLTKRIKL